MTGQSIAHYRVTAKLGQGGMGAVYRATDTKLGREVAIKVLPDTFAQDPERLARFEREAKILASLNHPNIAAIHGLEQVGNSQALVLELVEGEDLSERLKRGPLPLEEALDVCRQIAEALEAAHEKGIIHRDLKPGNVKLTADGQVKVLDFGLAKTGNAETTVISPDSPTITADHTLPGTLLGTAGYMSPEQARGKPVDRRSDIWSFGVVLFECLTGKRLFPGETVTDSIGALLHKEIDWSRLPPNTPPGIQLLLRKCLARDRKRRLPDIGAARLDVEQAIADPDSSTIRAGEATLRETRSGTIISRVAMAGIVAVAVLVTVVLMTLLKPQAPPAPVRRLPIELGEKFDLLLDRGVSIRFSPDGSALVFMATERGDPNQRLYLRRLDELQATPIPGTEGVNDFCFAPDGRSIVFNHEGLTVVPLANGKPTKLARISRIRGLAWGRDDSIYVGGRDRGIRTVSLTTNRTLTALGSDRGESSHRQPTLLPGGQAVLFSASKMNGKFDDSDILIRRLPEGEPELVLSGGYSPRYVPTGRRRGHLVYMSQGALFAVGFDPDSLRRLGSPTQIIPEVMPDTGDNVVGHFDISTDGTLAYVRESLSATPDVLEWLDRDGEREELKGFKAANIDSFALSPDGRLLAYSVDNGRQSSIVIHDIDRQLTRNRLTTGQANETGPVWSSGGESLVFASQRGDEVAQVYWRRADGSGDARQLFPSQTFQRPWCWRGDQLVIGDQSGMRLFRIHGGDGTGWTLSPTNDSPVHHLKGWDGASISPDGRWIAYTSDELDGKQVWVSRVGSGETGQRVSREGGSMPVWSPNTGEILFEVPKGRSHAEVHAVRFQLKGDALELGTSVPWTTNGTFAAREGARTNFDLDQTGQRLLVRKLAASEQERTFHQLVLIENFFALLNQKVPLDQR